MDVVKTENKAPDVDLNQIGHLTGKLQEVMAASKASTKLKPHYERVAVIERELGRMHELAKVAIGERSVLVERILDGLEINKNNLRDALASLMDAAANSEKKE